MNALRRLKLILRANVETLLNEVENHHATIHALLSDMKDGIAAIKAEQNATFRRKSTLEAEIQSLQQTVQRWEQRAIASKDNEAKALQCVRYIINNRKFLEKKQHELAEEEKLQTKLI